MGRRRRRLSDQPFELDITALGADGMGVAEHDNRRLRVFDALADEQVSARYLFGRNRKGMAETLKVLRASPERVEPRCPHFGVCGACNMQHLSMPAQLDHKQSALLQCLRDQGGVEPATVYPPLSGELWNYRRKARLSVRDVAAKDRVLVGFRERNGRYVAVMDTCHILRKEIAAALPGLCTLVEGLDARTRIPQIEVACGDDRCALVFRHLDALSANDRARLRGFALDTGLAVYLQSGGPESVELLAPEDFQLQYAIGVGDLRVQFEPLDFIQVNGQLNRLVIERAIDLLAPDRTDNVLDLFCGLGNFTLPLASRAARVTGIEGSAEMVRRARANAKLNDLDNVTFLGVDLYPDTPEWPTGSPWPESGFNKVLLDPPRSGARDLIPWIARASVERILYVSCNPETLGKDAGLLVREHGFTLAGAGVLNMFPHTPHSEAIALFERGRRT